MSGEHPATPTRTRRGRVLLVAALIVLAGLIAVGAQLAGWLGARRAMPASTSTGPLDPRRAYTGPYRNIDPDVAYVGNASCVECHDDIAATYARHPMGRSLVPARELLDQQRYAPDTNNPFTALGRQFRAQREGNRLWHRQALLDEPGKPRVERSLAADWVIGSGQRGHSYLTEQNGYLLQTPISWFAPRPPQPPHWGLSPGFMPSVLAGRLVPASCLFCHANGVRAHPEHPDRFKSPVFAGHAIGCERCHGPGELHVRERRAGGRIEGDTDYTIVNPARLSAPLREAVCEQCHLEGETRILRCGQGLFDFRPGLPLHDFWAVLIQGPTTGADAKAVNHVEQMYQSKCFQRSAGEGRLGCITCHDPHVHVGPRKRQPHYRAACLKCHNEAKGQIGCSVPLRRRQQTSPPDSCIDCHMPRYTASDIPHTASTDHRIVRRPGHRGGRPDRATDPDRSSFVDFYRDRYPEGDPQAERNLGVGLVKMMTAGMLAPERHGKRAVRLLESALGQFPHDVELRESKALALVLLRRPAEALPEARSVLAKRPGNWRLLAYAAMAAQAEGQVDQAIGYWRQAVAINPVTADYQVSLLSLLIQTGQMDEARARCRELLELDPFNVAGRQLWVGFLLREGKKAEAGTEFDIIRRLEPPDLGKREEWFKKQLRQEK